MTNAHAHWIACGMVCAAVACSGTLRPQQPLWIPRHLIPPTNPPVGMPSEIVSKAQDAARLLHNLKTSGDSPIAWIQFLATIGSLDVALHKFAYAALPWDPDRTDSERRAFKPLKQWAKQATGYWEEVLKAGWLNILAAPQSWLKAHGEPAETGRKALLQVATQLHDLGNDTDNAEAIDAAVALYGLFLAHLETHDGARTIRRNLAIIEKNRGNFRTAAELFQTLAKEGGDPRDVEANAYQTMICLTRALGGPQQADRDDELSLYIRDIADLPDRQSEIARRMELLHAIDVWLGLTNDETEGAAEAHLLGALLCHYSHQWADAYVRLKHFIETYPVHSFYDRAREMSEQDRQRAGIPMPDPITSRQEPSAPQRRSHLRQP